MFFDDDVGAARLPNQVQVRNRSKVYRLPSVASGTSAPDRPGRSGLLCWDVGVFEERTLGLAAEQREDGQRRKQPVVAQLCGGGLFEEARVVVLHVRPRPPSQIK